MEQYGSGVGLTVGGERGRSCLVPRPELSMGHSAYDHMTVQVRISDVQMSRRVATGMFVSPYPEHIDGFSAFSQPNVHRTPSTHCGEPMGLMKCTRIPVPRRGHIRYRKRRASVFLVVLPTCSERASLRPNRQSFVLQLQSTAVAPTTWRA